MFLSLFSVAVFLLMNVSIAFAESEWDMTCNQNNIAVDKDTKKFHELCYKELNISPENSSCAIQCLFRKFNLTDTNGQPSKVKFDMYCDAKVDTKIRNKMKSNITCFKDHASKIKQNDIKCETSVEFDLCFQAFIDKVCIQE